jgi:hypothetical protein
MRTFSEIIDTALAVTNMPAYLKYAISAANSVISEISNVSLSEFDMAEYSMMISEVPIFSKKIYQYRRTQVPATIAKWTIPFDFKSIRAIHYGGPIPNGEFVDKKMPGRIQENGAKYWYQTGDTIILSGAHGRVDISYYRLSKAFIYVKPDKRLLASDDNSFYKYRDTSETSIWIEFNNDNNIHREAYNRHVNWVIKDHAHTILEGLLARLYNSRGDLQRGGRHYQQYTAAKQLITNKLGSHLEGQI